MFDAVQQLDDDDIQLRAAATEEDELMVVCNGDNRGGQKNRTLSKKRCSLTWLFDFVLQIEFRNFASLKAIVRVPYEVLLRLLVL